MKPDSHQGKLEVKTLNITYEGIETKWTKMTPKSLRKKVTQIYEYTQTDPKRAIQEISKIYLRHQELPILNNYLTLSYQEIGDTEHADKITVKTYRSFPGYLFAKTNYAHICLRKGELDKIKEIFEHKSDLQSLYPERKVFHYTEFLAFMNIWAIYYYKTGEKKAAIVCYNSMKIVDAEHPITQSTKISIRQTWLFWLMGKIFGKERLDKKIDEALKAKQTSWSHKEKP
ncbi:tetratricopeptide repeat protein [Candidatus Electrothrix sp.]|uniref:tetratricopeptide repeat protein n=1 Tax=Candidatus Electrothrix sp. TaxID=2170559 RepID=UPI004055CFC9